MLLAQSLRRPNVLWALPALFSVWVNTHGSWIIGVALLLIYAATSALRFRWGSLESPGLSAAEVRRLLLICRTSAAALFVNPYGWRLVAYPFNLAFRQRLNIQNVEEWKGLDFHSARGLTVLTCLGLLAALQLCRPRRWTACEFAYLLVAIYSAFHYSRFLFLLAILVAPILACSRRHPGRRPPRTSTRFMLTASILLALVGLVIFRLRHQEATDRRLDELFPTRALTYLAASPPCGHVFNEYLWGDYLIWHMPRQQVFIDSRTDIFQYNGTFRDYLDIIRIKDSLSLFRQV